MTISCNIKMLCLELNWFCYDPSRMLQLTEFVRNLRSSVWDVFKNFLIIDATDRRKISSDQKWLFIAVSLYPFQFFANTPFKLLISSLTTRNLNNFKILKIWSDPRLFLNLQDNLYPFPFLYLLHKFVSYNSKLLISGNFANI